VIKRRSYGSRVLEFLIAALNIPTDSPCKNPLSTGLAKSVDIDANSELYLFRIRLKMVSGSVGFGPTTF
jgi:hypothetical protein